MAEKGKRRRKIFLRENDESPEPSLGDTREIWGYDTRGLGKLPRGGWEPWRTKETLRGKKCGGGKTEEMIGPEREKYLTDYASRKRASRLGGGETGVTQLSHRTCLNM